MPCSDANMAASNSVSFLTVEREDYGYDQGGVPAVGRHAFFPLVRSQSDY